jgi:hypothetical protein
MYRETSLAAHILPKAALIGVVGKPANISQISIKRRPVDSGGKVIILLIRKPEEVYHASLSGAACRSQERGRRCGEGSHGKGPHGH